MIGVTADTDLTGPIVNTAVANAADDRSPNNDAASIGADLAPIADLTVALSLPAGGDAGGSSNGTLTVTNAGPSDAATPEVVLPLPPGFTLDVGTGAPAGVSCSQTGSIARCTLGSLAPSSPLVIPVVMRVAPSVAPASYDLSGWVGTTTAESGSANNDTATSFAVTNSVDLSITKTGPATALAAGSTAEYVVTLSNTGTSDTLPSSTGHVISDTFADGLTVLSATATLALPARWPTRR